MDIRIEVRDESGTDPAAGALVRWLTRVDELRGRVSVVRPELPPESMGGVADVVAIALGSGGAGTALAGAVVTWLNQRTSDVTLTFTRDGQSTQLTVQARRAKDPQALLGSVERFLAEDGHGPVGDEAS